MKLKYDLEKFGKSPIFMPDATKGSVRYITTEQLKKIGMKGVVINTLHLASTITADRIARLGGMHNFMNWDGYILSDSGGFQIFSLLHSKKWKGEINNDGAIFKSPKDGSVYTLTPESSIDIQIKLGSDILVVLDDCRDANISRSEAEKSVKKTIEWAKRAKAHFEIVYGGKEKTGKLLSAVVQGADHLDLREKCAKELVKIGFDGYNFGGYVIGEDGKLVLDQMKVVAENTPDDKFRYAMGVGKPGDIIAGYEIGYKVFDTVLVTRNARHGTLYSSSSEENGQVIHIKNSFYSEDTLPVDQSCDCEACTSHSRAYLHNLFKNDEATALHLMTIHNLRYYQRLINDL